MLYFLMALMSVACSKQENPYVSEGSKPKAASVPRGERFVYVPAYTYAVAATGQKTTLAATLTIHNAHSKSSMRIRSVEYHDSPGKTLSHYLDEPRVLKPLETLEFQVLEVDMSRGSGASFIVSYDPVDADGPPLVEAVMVGNTGSGWLAFTSRGVPLPD